MTIVVVDTYNVAKGSFVQHEKFVNETLMPTTKRLDKRLKSASYFSAMAAQGISPMGGRMFISEYDSLADMEKSNQELQASDEYLKLTDRFAELIETSSFRSSIWITGTWELYKHIK